MEIKRVTLSDVPKSARPLTACIGYFDGLHLGHQRLVESVVNDAKKDETIPSLITFDPDPWVVLRGMHDPAHLTTMEDRARIAQQMGIECFLILDFTEAMSALDTAQFHALLAELGVTRLVCGHDFHYGHYGSGSVETLRAQDAFALTVIEPITYDGVRISSSRIEQLISEGNVALAARLLGRFYFLRGHVARGFRRGTTMHFPTANLAMSDHYLLPKSGVYAGLAAVDGRCHEAMINVGNNPTFQNEQLTIEANLFDFDEMIYEKPITFYFIDYIRSERRFDSREDLIWQLKSDRERIRGLFEQHPEWKEEPLCV